MNLSRYTRAGRRLERCSVDGLVFFNHGRCSLEPHGRIPAIRLPEARGKAHAGGLWRRAMTDSNDISGVKRRSYSPPSTVKQWHLPQKAVYPSYVPFYAHQAKQCP